LTVIFSLFRVLTQSWIWDKMPHTLSRRAVACGGWRWLRGMLRQDDYRYIGSGVWARWSDVHSLTTALHAPGQLPDLTDSSTRGCLLALVREAWGDSEMHMALGAKGWVWLTGESRVYDVVIPINAGGTEAAALVAALEAAP